MNFAVAIPTNGRPQYLRRVLASLAMCEEMPRWSIYGSNEPAPSSALKPLYDECMSLFRFRRACAHQNLKQHGPSLNFWSAFRRPFRDGHDYVVLVEEDTIVAQDFLRWHEFAATTFRSDPTVFTVAGGNYEHKGQINPDQLMQFRRHKGFWAKGWGTWRDRWFEPEGMSENWEREDTGYEGYIWKHHLRGRDQIMPLVTRVNDIGETGFKCTPEYYKQVVEIQDWADLHPCVGPYVEVK